MLSCRRARRSSGRGWRGVSILVATSGLIANNVYTMWWIVFNHPTWSAYIPHLCSMMNGHRFQLRNRTSRSSRTSSGISATGSLPSVRIVCLI